MRMELVTNKFSEIYTAQPLLSVRSPGRINLIGEHTDYNDGLVMPASIDKEIYFAISPRKDQLSQVFALDLNESDTFNHEYLRDPSKKWTGYLKGVVEQFYKNGYKVNGFDLVFGGNLPTGAGISSSAALECGLAFCVNKLFDLGISTVDLVKMSQQAEREFVGVNCGIMDQYAAMFGKKRSLIKLDCRSLQAEYVPFETNEYTLLLCDTGVKHSLGDSEYNKRRQECEAGVSILKKHDPEIKSLRDISKEILGKHRDEFPSKVYDRCLYVVEEIARVFSAGDDLSKNDFQTLGKRMYETHDGLQHLYEVSCDELDFLVQEARKDENILGARMMGGGFGGSTINLLRTDSIESVSSKLSEKYKQQFNRELVIIQANITDGTSAY